MSKASTSLLLAVAGLPLIVVWFNPEPLGPLGGSPELLTAPTRPRSAVASQGPVAIVWLRRPSSVDSSTPGTGIVGGLAERATGGRMFRVWSAQSRISAVSAARAGFRSRELTRVCSCFLGRAVELTASVVTERLCCPIASGATVFPPCEVLPRFCEGADPALEWAETAGSRSQPASVVLASVGPDFS